MHRALPGELPRRPPRDAEHLRARAAGPAGAPLAYHAARDRHVARGHARDRLREGPGQRAAALRGLPRHGLREHGPPELRGLGPGAGGCGLRGPLWPLRPRADPRGHLARPLRLRPGQRLPAGAEPLLACRRRPLRRRHRARPVHHHPHGGKRLHLLRHSRGDGPSGCIRRADPLRALRRARPCHRGPRQERRGGLHRRRPHGEHQPAGLHHRGRHYRAHPPHRHHPALHEPGRQQPHRQLHRRGPAAQGGQRSNRPCHRDDRDHADQPRPARRGRQPR